MKKLYVERVDHENEITYEVNYEKKGFHVVFYESNCIESGLSAKHEAEKYVSAVNDHEAAIKAKDLEVHHLKRSSDVLLEHHETAMKLKDKEIEMRGRWLPIDTAPRDGTIIIGNGYYDYNHKEPMHAHAVMSNGGAWWKHNSGYGFTSSCHPIYWIAMPTAMAGLEAK